MKKAVIIYESYKKLKKLINELEKMDEYEIMGVYGEEKLAIRKIAGIRPDIVFLDAELPGVPAADLFRKIRKQSPNTRIIVITPFYQYFGIASKLGRQTCLLTPVSGNKLQKILEM